MSEEKILMTFKAICSFVDSMNSEFGTKHKPLKLYNVLISKTPITSDNIINKHIQIFRDFCTKNRDSFLEKNHKNFVERRLIYNERIYVDMEHIFNIADKECTDVIWKHLLTISALVDPNGKAREVLKTMTVEAPDVGDGTKEKDFLKNIVSKMENLNIGSDVKNPMEAIPALMSSGIFTDLLGGLKDGKMNLGNLLGAVQGVMSEMSSKAGDSPENQQAMNMISNLGGLMGNMNLSGDSKGAGGQGFDIGSMIQMITPMLSSLSLPTPPVAGSTSLTKVEEVNEVEDDKPSDK